MFYLFHPLERVKLTTITKFYRAAVRRLVPGHSNYVLSLSLARKRLTSGSNENFMGRHFVE